MSSSIPHSVLSVGTGFSFLSLRAAILHHVFVKKKEKRKARLSLENTMLSGDIRGLRRKYFYGGLMNFKDARLSYVTETRWLKKTTT